MRRETRGEGPQAHGGALPPSAEGHPVFTVFQQAGSPPYMPASLAPPPQEALAKAATGDAALKARLAVACEVRAWSEWADVDEPYSFTIATAVWSPFAAPQARAAAQTPGAPRPTVRGRRGELADRLPPAFPRLLLLPPRAWRCRCGGTTARAWTASTSST